jgi:CHASE3 domain sensor protein
VPGFIETVVMISSIERKLLIYLGAILLIVLVLGVFVYQGIKSMNVESEWVYQVANLKFKIEEMHSDIKTANLR